MLWVILGIISGVAIGILSKFSIPVEYARYTAVAIIAILDSLFGAWRAYLIDREYAERQGEGRISNRPDRYSSRIFITGLLFNTALAASITYMGDRLGLDLYLAALVAFTIRIFTNLGTIRRLILDKYFKSDDKKEEPERPRKE